MATQARRAASVSAAQISECPRLRIIPPRRVDDHHKPPQRRTSGCRSTQPTERRRLARSVRCTERRESTPNRPHAPPDVPQCVPRCHTARATTGPSTAPRVALPLPGRRFFACAVGVARRVPSHTCCDWLVAAAAAVRLCCGWTSVPYARLDAGPARRPDRARPGTSGCVHCGAASAARSCPRCAVGRVRPHRRVQRDVYWHSACGGGAEGQVERTACPRVRRSGLCDFSAQPPVRSLSVPLLTACLRLRRRPVSPSFRCGALAGRRRVRGAGWVPGELPGR